MRGRKRKKTPKKGLSSSIRTLDRVRDENSLDQVNRRHVSTILPIYYIMSTSLIGSRTVYVTYRLITISNGNRYSDLVVLVESHYHSTPLDHSLSHLT